MKNYFFLLAFCLPFFFLSSCSKDDDSKKDSIDQRLVGTWAFKQLKYSEDGEWSNWSLGETTVTFTQDCKYEGDGYPIGGSGTCKMDGKKVKASVSTKHSSKVITFDPCSDISNSVEFYVEINDGDPEAAQFFWVYCEKENILD